MAVPYPATSRVSFVTCDVAVAEQPLKEIPYRNAVASILVPPHRESAATIEACSQRIPSLVPAYSHGLISTLHHAFASHRPLVLTPDHIWLLICQGFARHVNVNAEKLRRDFVKHEGKKLLEIRRPDLVKGDTNNDWQGTVAEFSQQIKSHLGDHHDLLSAKFSTTTPIEQAAFEIIGLTQRSQRKAQMIN